MKIEFIEPVFKAWDRMLKILFKPFNFVFWLSLGFSAWMANLFEGPPSPFSWNTNISLPDNSKMKQLFDLIELKEKSFESINIFSQATATSTSSGGASGEGMVFIVTFVVLFLVALLVITLVVMVLLSWLKSVFELIFIDHLLSAKFILSESWKNNLRLGTSAFIWRIIFYLITFLFSMVILTVAALICFPWMKSCWDAGSFLPPDLSISIACGFFLLLTLFVSLFSLCVNVVFRQFIIALMYKNSVGAIEGWSIFFNLTRNRRFEIVKFLLFWLGLNIMAWLIVTLIVLLTCCLLAITFIFPYIWAVVLLPLLVFFRLYSLEFLSQFSRPESDFFGNLQEN